MLKCEVIGNLGSDPELKYSTNGTAILRCNVAANYRTKDEGEWVERTEWVRVSVFGNRAETLGGLLKKGTKVYVSGRLEARPWTANDGSIRAGLEIAAGDVELMSPRSADESRQPVAAGSKGEDDGDLESLPF